MIDYISSGPNAQLSYSILSSNVSISGLLIIGSTDGIITKLSGMPFDRETTGNIQLTIVARDNGSPRRSGTTEVLIELQVCAIKYCC